MVKFIIGALAVVCCFTIAASGFLTLSYLTLKGVDHLRPLLPFVVFVAQSALTLAVLGHLVSAGALDVLLMVGAAGLMWLGWSIADSTLSGPHFEGYALVMGAAGVLQGALTLVRGVWRMLDWKDGTL